MRRALLVVIGVALVIGVCGCEKIKELKQAAEQAAEQVVKQVKDEVDPSRQMLSAYAKGYNEVLNSFQDLVDNYARAIPLDKEPSAELGNVHFFGSGNYDMSLKTIKEAFDAASDKAPEKYKHLKPLADELYGACKDLADHYGRARAYYQAEDFKDDEYAAGKEIHGKMRTAVERFDAALRQMEAALSVEEDKLMEEELAEYKDQKSYAYQFRFVHFKAKRTLGLIDSRESTAESIDQAVEEFVKVYDELKAFADGQASPNAAFKSYVDQVERFVSALKRFRREVQAEEADPDKLRQEHDAIVSSYNTLISLRNSLSQLEAAGQL